MTVFVGNTNLLELLGLRNNQTGSYINNGVVTAVIKDKNGVNLVLPDAGTWPLTLAYNVGSDGDYSVILPVIAGFTAGQRYTAYIDIDYSGNIGHWEVKFYPEKRIVLK